jgi:hypothetical protein
MKTILLLLLALWSPLVSGGVADWENYGQVLTGSNTTTTVAGAVTTGLRFGISQGESWQFEFFILSQCSGTGGIKYQLAVPAGATVRAVVIGGGATAAAITSAQITASATLTSVVFNNAAVPGWARIFGTVTAGGTSGLVTAGYASATAGQTSTVMTGSSVRATKL